MSVRKIQVPDAPKDLWRQIARIVKKDPKVLWMRCWHGEVCNENVWPSPVFGKKAAGCATTHCIGGWVTFLTPGGLDLEVSLRRRNLLLRTREEKEAMGVTPYAGSTHDIVAAAALLILEKAGWSKDFSSQTFYVNEGMARHVIERLARREARRGRSSHG